MESTFLSWSAESYEIVETSWEHLTVQLPQLTSTTNRKILPCSSEKSKSGCNPVCEPKEAERIHNELSMMENVGGSSSTGNLPESKKKRPTDSGVDE